MALTCFGYKKSYVYYCRRRTHDEDYYAKEGILIQCDICNARVFELRHHMKSQHNFKMVECKYCGKVMKDCHLNKHVKRKHLDGPKVHTCQTCGYTCTDTQIFKFHCVTKHDDTSHGTVKVFTCEYCGLKSKAQKSLDIHIKAVHDKCLC